MSQDVVRKTESSYAYPENCHLFRLCLTFLRLPPEHRNCRLEVESEDQASNTAQKESMGHNIIQFLYSQETGTIVIRFVGLDLRQQGKGKQDGQQGQHLVCYCRVEQDSEDSGSDEPQEEGITQVLDDCPAEIGDEEGEHRQALAEQHQEDPGSAEGEGYDQVREEGVGEDCGHEEAQRASNCEYSGGVRGGVLQESQFLGKVLQHDLLVLEISAGIQLGLVIGGFLYGKGDTVEVKHLTEVLVEVVVDRDDILTGGHFKGKQVEHGIPNCIVGEGDVQENGQGGSDVTMGDNSLVLVLIELLPFQVPKDKCLDLILCAPAMVAILPHPVVPSHQEHRIIVGLLEHLLDELGHLVDLDLQHRVVDCAPGVANVVYPQQMGHKQTRTGVALAVAEQLGGEVVVDHVVTGVQVVDVEGVGADG